MAKTRNKDHFTHHTQSDIDFVFKNKYEMTISEIGEDLNITESTVKYILRVYRQNRKMNHNN